MPKTRPVILLCAVTCLLSALSLAQGTKLSTETSAARRAERDNPTERAKWFLRGRTYQGRPAPELLERAYRQKMNKRAAARARAAGTQTVTTSEGTSAVTSAVRQSFIQSSGGPSWTPLGPAPSGTSSDGSQDYGPAAGRATVVLVDQTDTSGNTVYLGGASGGLWKSSNAADPAVLACTQFASSAPYCAPNVTWTPLIDNQASLTVGAMAIRPGNNQWLLVGTGEANNSADSYYGLGFLLSQNGGNSWQLMSTANGGAVDLHGLGTTRIAFNADSGKSNIVVGTMAAASGGITVGAEFGGANARGIYFSNDAGQSWFSTTVQDNGLPCTNSGFGSPCTPQAGSANDVVFNPYTHTFYANIRWHGFYSSTDGQNWVRMPSQPGPGTLNLDANCPSTTDSSGACPLYRAVMTIVPNRPGPNGKGEMYVWIVNSSDTNKGIFVTTDGGATWSAVSTAGIDTCGDGTSNGCSTQQGSYNLTLLGVPNGAIATDLYAGAVNQFKCSISDPSQTAALCNQSGTNNYFANLTHVYWDCGTGDGNFANVHPDEHGIDFVWANPSIIYFANDGGVYRTLNGFSTAKRTCNGVTTPQPQPWLQFDNLSGTMGSMIQYVWFSHHPSDTSILIGGTQDNGSMAKSSSSASSPAGYGYTWRSINNGDGGWTDINQTSANEWFTSNGGYWSTDGIQQCGSGTSCTTGMFQSVIKKSTVGGDEAPFYFTYMLDPQAPNHMLVGTCRLWRANRPGAGSTSWSASGALSYDFYLFATQGTFTCPTQTTSNGVAMVSAIAAGGPTTGNGSQVIYAGTDAGKVYVTTNADGGPSAWIDASANGFVNNSNTNCPGTQTSCGYPISGIAVDPHDATGRTAYVTVMGFKTGHVFRTTDAGQHWTNIDGPASGTGLPDNPADAVVVDPSVTNQVYVAMDVGVFKCCQLGDGVWEEVGPSGGAGMLPNVAATALHVFGTGATARLRVSTYGRGIWEIPIPNTPGFQLTVTPLSATVQTGQPATFTGTIAPFNGYNSAISVQCTNLDPSVTCSPAQQTVAAGATSFTLTATGTAIGDYTFNITAIGTDDSAVTQQVAVTLHVGDFTLSAPSPDPLLLGHGTSGNVSVTLGTQGSYSGTVNLTCIPDEAAVASTVTCTPTEAAASLPADNGRMMVFTVVVSPGAPVGSHPVTITATPAAGTAHTTSFTLGISLNPTFVLSAGPAPSVRATTSGQQTITAASQDGWSGTVALTSTYPGSAVTPSSVAVTTSTPGTATLTVPTTKDQSGPLNLIVSGAGDGNTSGLVTAPFTVMNYAIDPVSGQNGNGSAPPGGSVTMTFVLYPQSGYTGSIVLGCNVSSLGAGATCAFNSSAGVVANGSSATAAVTGSDLTVSAVVGVPSGTASNNYQITFSSHDASATALDHPYTPTVIVQDYKITATPGAAVVTAGGSAVFTLVAAGGSVTYDANTVCTGLPAKTTCALDKTTATAGASVTLTIRTTAATVAQVRPGSPAGDAPHSLPLWAFWLAMPGAGLVFGSAGGCRRKLLARLGLLTAVVFIGLLASCGGGGGSTTTQPPVPVPGTPSGTYTVTVTGSFAGGSGTVTRSTQVTLSVQ
jgi:hypothetical protein